MTKPAALLLVWRHPTGVTDIQEFTHDGDLTTVCREIAAGMELADGGAAFWRGVAGDFQREVFTLQQHVRDLNKRIDEQNKLNEFVQDKLKWPFVEVPR